MGLLNQTRMSENKLQAECYQWAYNTFPEVRGLLYHNFNNPKNAIQGAQLKAVGLVKGVADLTFLWQGQAYFFELKTETGKQSKDQFEWQMKVGGHGFPYLIVRRFEHFKQLFEQIIYNGN